MTTLDCKMKLDLCWKTFKYNGMNWLLTRYHYQKSKKTSDQLTSLHPDCGRHAGHRLPQEEHDRHDDGQDEQDDDDDDEEGALTLTSFSKGGTLPEGFP